METIAAYYNAKELSKLLKVHYKTVLYWWKHGQLEGARRSGINNKEIWIPRSTAAELYYKYRFRKSPKTEIGLE